MTKHKKTELSKSQAVRDDTANPEQGYVFTVEEQEQYATIEKRILKARSAREETRDEFDGQNYENTYLANKRAAHSYLQPKRNEKEVRVNTGTTEKRVELVLNELLSMNLRGEIRVFDKDDTLLQDVSEVFTDIVDRTNQIESSEDKRRYMYYELLTQPCLFAEELWVKEPGLKSKRFRCEKRMLQGPQIYLGDINLPDTRFNEQPFILKYQRMGYKEAERTFKDLNPEKWKLIKPGGYSGSSSLGAVSNRIYRKGALQEDEVEAFWYFSYPDNEVQAIVNGIPMLDVGEKYTDHFGDFGTYHITMVSLKALSADFAYGKSLVQSAKTLQALNNEMIRNMVRKFRQALEPPIGTVKRNMFNRDIWSPGTVTHGIKRSDFEKLIDHNGVTQAEMAMFDLVEKKVNEFVGTSQAEPLQGKSRTTATEFVLAQQRAVKLLGNAVLAATILENRLTILRLKNALNNYSKPISRKMDPLQGKVQSVFARFTLDDADLGDEKGTKVIQLTDRSLNKSEREAIFEIEQTQRKKGNPIQYKFMNVNALKGLGLFFFASSLPKPKDSSELDKAMFTEMLNQGVAITQITGRFMKQNRIIDKFERVWRERGLFEQNVSGIEEKAKEMTQGQQGQQEGEPPTEAKVIIPDKGSAGQSIRAIPGQVAQGGSASVSL